MKHHIPTRRVARHKQAWIGIIFVMVALFLAVGCGRQDLGSVTGQVMYDGEARGFQAPESMRMLFTAISTDRPMTFSGDVLPDGKFSADLNDGTGRGIPEGTYAVTIDTDGLLIKDPKQKSIPEINPDGTPNADAMYPRPGVVLKTLLQKATCTIQLQRGKTVRLVVDLNKGEINELLH